MAERRARATWEGDLFTGKGTVSAESSRLFTEASVTWAARTEAPEGRTSPEELIAAAHAACFCMAFSNELSSRGHVPSRLRAQAVCGFEGGRVTTVVLDVQAAVPGIDRAGFDDALAAAEQSCPVSNALRGNVEIKVSGSMG
ncbi:MAG TPA: OsmC family peroxiredoxin [Acidimicrobiales bacterium]|nr:OsmC family peroxiredoxin [Acidimicrobiales bacterium]